MSKRYKGILCILAAAFCFAIMNACVRASGDLPDLGKGQLEAVLAGFFDPRPQSLVFPHKITPPAAGKV